MVNEAEQILTLLRPLEGQNGDGTISEDLLVKLITSLEGEVWTGEQVQKLIHAASSNSKANRVRLSDFVGWLYSQKLDPTSVPENAPVAAAPAKVVEQPIKDEIKPIAAEPKIPAANVPKEPPTLDNKSIPQPIKNEGNDTSSAPAPAPVLETQPPAVTTEAPAPPVKAAPSAVNLAGAWSVQGGAESAEVKIKQDSSGVVEVALDESTSMKGDVQGNKLILDAGDGNKMELTIAADGMCLEAEDGEKWVRVGAASKPPATLPALSAPVARKPNRNTPLQAIGGANPGAGPDLMKLPPPGAVLGSGPDLTKLPPPAPVAGLAQPDLSKIPPPVITASRPSSQATTAQPAPGTSNAQPDLSKIPPPVAAASRPSPLAQPDLSKIPPPVPKVQSALAPPPGASTAQPDLSKIPPPVVSASRPNAQPDLSKIPPPV